MTDNLIKISAVIITKNEELNIGRAIKSLEGFSEIIVLDSGSTDRTVEIAKSLGAKVYQTDWPGFSNQRKRGLEYATQPWILFLDADELLNKSLFKEIGSLDLNKAVNGYFIRRENHFIGRPVKYSRWGNDWQLRLFHKKSANISEVDIHEGVIINGATAKIAKGCIIHNTVPSLYKYLEKMNEYTSLEAMQKTRENRKFSAARLIWEPISEVWKILIVWQGWRDGIRGFSIAMLSAMGRFVVMIKMRELQNG